MPTAGSGNVQLFLTPNPRTIDSGTTLILSANNFVSGTAQIPVVTNAADLAVFSSTGVDFALTDRVKPRRTLADLLRALVQALTQRLAAFKS